MSTSPRDTAAGALRGARRAWQDSGRGAWWSERREASLNWLALGVLLAAWNASDNDSSQTTRRPEALRRYSYVSVRATTLHAATLQTGELRRTSANR
jgi:hypothetical protein